MEGKDFWKGELESPYCNIKFLKSFLSLISMPLNSATSRSNQLAAKNNSVKVETFVDLFKTFFLLKLLQELLELLVRKM